MILNLFSAILRENSAPPRPIRFLDAAALNTKRRSTQEKN
jgi:hypothetical protein